MRYEMIDLFVMLSPPDFKTCANIVFEMEISDIFFDDLYEVQGKEFYYSLNCASRPARKVVRGQVEDFVPRISDKTILIGNGEEK